MDLEHSCSPRSNTSIKNRTASLNISNRQSCSRTLCSAQLRTAFTVYRQAGFPSLSTDRLGSLHCLQTGWVPFTVYRQAGFPSLSTDRLGSLHCLQTGWVPFTVYRQAGFPSLFTDRLGSHHCLQTGWVPITVYRQAGFPSRSTLATDNRQAGFPPSLTICVSAQGHRGIENTMHTVDGEN